MIECLSDHSWLSPQIDFLLFLQNIRLCSSEFIDKFFLSITLFGEFWLPTLVCAIVYWCVDFRAGVYLFSLESINSLIAHFLKMIACVYRPWVLDSRINPSALAVPYAKGYSFPSGHSAMSSSVLGGVAFLFRKNKIACILLIGLILLIGFSRLWLGVHTPQDVVCGLTIGLILVFAVNKVINWAEENKDRYMCLLGVIDVLAVLALAYSLFFNTYRIDYVNGEILVNPAKLKYVTTVVYSYILGVINGCFLCRVFCPFDPKNGSLKQRIIRGIVGAVFLIFLLKIVMGYVIMNMLSMKITAPIMFLSGISITLLYPIIFTKLENK